MQLGPFFVGRETSGLRLGLSINGWNRSASTKIPMLSCDKAYPYNFYCRLSTVAEVEILAPVQKSGGQKEKVPGPFRLKQLSDLSFSSRFRFFTKSESSIIKSRVEQLESAACKNWPH